MSTHHQGTETEILALDTFIKLMRGVDTLTQAMSEKYRLCNRLTASQFGIMEALYHLGPLQQNEIAEKMLLTPGNITLVIDNLEKRDLVKRERNSEDRRCITVHLTKEGDKLISEIFPENARFITETLSLLNPQEQAELSRIMKKLGLSLKEKMKQTKLQAQNL